MGGHYICNFLESQKARVREKTYLGYRGHLEGRLIGYFKGRKLKTIRLVDVESFLAAMARAGLRRIRFHDLRHSYAAALLSRGENPKFVQRQLGHSSI